MTIPPAERDPAGLVLAINLSVAGRSGSHPWPNAR